MLMKWIWTDVAKNQQYVTGMVDNRWGWSMHGEVMGATLVPLKKKLFLIYHPVCRYGRWSQMCLWHVNLVTVKGLEILSIAHGELTQIINILLHSHVNYNWRQTDQLCFKWKESVGWNQNLCRINQVHICL